MNGGALRPVWVGTFVAAVVLQLLVPLGATGLPSAAAAVQAASPPAPGAITLHVQAARSVNNGPGFVHKGDPVTTYKWLINIDDTGDPGTSANPLTTSCLPATAGVGVGSADPNYADSCPWPSVRNTPGQAPIVAQGTEADLADATALSSLPGGKYLISVTADGFKIAGAHFRVDGGTQPVLVELDPTPLPLTTLRIAVFNDSAPVDATYEVDAEAGLPGFTAHLADVLGTVSTDYYGNALCTSYLHDPAPVGSTVAPMRFDDLTGRPVVDPASIGRCVSDATGEIVIPNLGPNRYAATVTPPVPAAGQTYQWVQTTTLEGGHDTDIWSQEAATGYDNEQTKGAELVPGTQFGFVQTQALPTTPGMTGELKGTVVAELPYIGGVGGQQNGEYAAGAKKGPPIADAWVALSNLALGDQVVYVGRAATDGTFDLKNVPVGDYQVSLWDDNQDYILWSFNATVTHNAVTDVGLSPLVGWFTHISGHVFIDSNGNGKRDPGEQPVPAFGLTVRERDNSLMDQATNTMTTDDTGLYDIRETYPMGKWLVLEAFNTRYQTTGVTYKSDNETTPTTRLGGAVDIDFLPIIGLGATIDWGVQPYASGTNGGIVGTVTYDTTRNELDAADAATEPYQPGIAGVPVHLYASVPCTATVANIPNECRQGKEIVPLQVPAAPGSATMIDNPSTDRGAFMKGPELQDAYTSETWAPPRGCTARMYDGTPLTDQQALPEFGAAANQMCVEAPMMGVTVGPSDTRVPNAFSQTVNGNYGFATSKRNLYPPTDTVHNPGGLALYALLPVGQEQDLPAADYIVSVEIPDNPVGGKPMYKVTSEEDVNVFDGDTYLPQENYPPATPADAAGVAGPGAKALAAPSQPPSQAAGIVSPCVGALHTVKVVNPAFLAGGGSPFEGYDQPLCGDKLVTVRTGQATAPNFNLFTDVPIPTHFWGLTLNDLGLSLDKRSVNYGEAQGIPFVPVGLYNWDGRLLDTTHTDFNGLYEALEPSTDTFNCPVPAGPCPNMYRFVGNDPGQPGQLNSDYNPRFRTIATNFQAWPGLYTVTDEAPTQVAATVLSPDATVANPTMCDLGAATPQLLAVDKPFLRKNGAAQSITVTGFGFGASGGPDAITLNGTSANISITSWSDTSITFSVPADFVPGPATLAITGNSGFSSVNGLTLQLLDAVSASPPGTTETNPKVAEVGPGKAYATVQAAIEASRPTNASRYWLIVVWPNTMTTSTPRGEYNENVVLHRRLRLQGVGPGGFDANGTFVPGSIIDGSGFNPDNPNGAAWIGLVGSLNVSGGGIVADGADLTVLSEGGGFGGGGGGGSTLGYAPAIDGFQLTGGSQADFAANILDLGTTTTGESTGAIVTQGGGVFVHANVSGLGITNNVIRGNSGTYGGGVRVGTPYAGNNRNYGVVIRNNQIRDNGGTSLAGGIGLFAGSDGYKVENNAICGNFSAEYGGAISAFGYQVHSGSGQPTPSIAHNRIWFNQSYDEGGGVFVAGELPSNPNNLSEGSGPVSIDANVIQANLANDDGGGIRLLQTTGSHVNRQQPERIRITNNTIANNVSAHEGGGIALDDAMFVDIVNNTVAKNITTATAVTSDGKAAPAGLSTAANSKALQRLLSNPSAFPRASFLHSLGFSKPTLLNNVFTDNRAGSFSGGWVRGIGGLLPDGSVNTVKNWDMGLSDLPGLLSPRSSVLQTTTGTDLPSTVATSSPVSVLSNVVTSSAGLVSPWDVTVNVLAFRSYPAFRQAVIVAELLPPNLMGDYHLGSASPAVGAGAASLNVPWSFPTATGAGMTFDLVLAPNTDIDREGRPTGSRYDAGSDQLP